MPRVTHAHNFGLRYYRLRFASPVAKVILRAPHAHKKQSYNKHDDRIDRSDDPMAEQK